MTTVLENLNTALQRAMLQDERVVLIGEDILDPYGGAFKVTRGLSSAFPDRVLGSPISEAGIVGVAAGMALRGLRPLVEIMFGDFVTLAADQLVNHIAKFRWMYNDQVRVPLVIRTPMGGRRGYGPTHSQTLEKLFLGVPGLKVVAPCAFQVRRSKSASKQMDAGGLLLNAIADNDPVIFIENKLLYLTPLKTSETLPDFEISIHSESHTYPTYKLAVRGAPPSILTLAAYGQTAELARDAALTLAYDYEIFTELIIPTQLTPFQAPMKAILASVELTERLLVAEEGTFSLGWGAEILARTTESIGPQLKAARRVAAQDIPTPASLVLEQAALPKAADIVQSARSMFV
ncbi:alpha-ketoacid dehydrogenase subunit beta [Chloroflexota bacterium]